VNFGCREIVLSESEFLNFKVMTYDETIKSSGTVLVEFYASWCPHCKRMMPIVEQAKQSLAGTVDVYQYDIDENRDLADQEQVQSIPTFIVYRNGSEAWRQTGEMTADALVKKIRQCIE